MDIEQANAQATERMMEAWPVLVGLGEARERTVGSVTVDERMGTIVWENGADIDPDVLYHDLKPAWMEDSELELAA